MTDYTFDGPDDCPVCGKTEQECLRGEGCPPDDDQVEATCAWVDDVYSAAEIQDAMEMGYGKQLLTINN